MSGTTKDWIEYHEKPVTLHSGEDCHWLVRADLIFDDEELREAVLRKWTTKLGNSGGYREFIGIARGGIPWAHAIADRLNGRCYDMTIAELTLYGHLLHAHETRHPLVVVDDVVTTGKSLGLVPHADAQLVVVSRRLLIPEGSKIHSWAHIPLPLCEKT